MLRRIILEYDTRREAELMLDGLDDQGFDTDLDEAGIVVCSIRDGESQPLFEYLLDVSK